MATGVKRLVLLAWLASSCSSMEPTEPAVSAESSNSAVASLRANVAAAYEELERDYAEIATEEVTQAMSSAREEWNRRVDRCGDDACRIGLLRDQLNRARYALGRNDRPVQGLRWGRGLFTFDGAGASGSLNILPIIDDRILVIGGTAQLPNATWVCELRAEGRIGANGVVEITTLDELRQRYRLAPLSPRRLRLTFFSDRTDRMCGLNGTLEGNYRVSVPAEPVTSGH